MKPFHVHGKTQAFFYDDILNNLGELSRESTKADPSEINLSGVGLIVARGVKKLDVDPVAIGSCILVGKEWVLTAHHVLQSHEFAQNFQAVFNFQSAIGKSVENQFEEAKKFNFSEDVGGFICSKDGMLSDSGHDYMNGDWVLIKININGEADHGINPMRPRRILAGDSKEHSRGFFIPYHQSEYGSKGGLNNPIFGVMPLHALITLKSDPNFIDTQRISNKSGWQIEHFAAAHNGASGAPLMSIDGKFVGLHVRTLKKTKGINPGLASSIYEIARSLSPVDFERVFGLEKNSIDKLFE